MRREQLDKEQRSNPRVPFFSSWRCHIFPSFPRRTCAPFRQRAAFRKPSYRRFPLRSNDFLPPVGASLCVVRLCPRRCPARPRAPRLLDICSLWPGVELNCFVPAWQRERMEWMKYASPPDDRKTSYKCFTSETGHPSSFRFWTHSPLEVFWIAESSFTAFFPDSSRVSLQRLLATPPTLFIFLFFYP